MIIELRRATGAGINDCQTALEQSQGNFEEAIAFLRKKGALKAEQKADRKTHEGAIAYALSPDKKEGAMVMLFTETDFVARNSDFLNFLEALVRLCLEGSDAKEEFEKKKQDMVLKLGENIAFGDAKRIQGASVSAYLHSNRKIGVLVSFQEPIDDALGHMIAMHIASENPRYFSPEDVEAEVVEREKAIYRKQLEGEGKPEAIVDRIIENKLQKFFAENCLLLQPFIKDESITIQKLLEKNGDAHIKEFIRFHV